MAANTVKTSSPYLVATHGPEYRDYATRAGRFLPGIGRLTPAPTEHAI